MKRCIFAVWSFEFSPFGPGTTELFLDFFFGFSKAKVALLVFLFLRTRVQKLMKECSEERERKAFMTQ
jgi:hypothetical protein